MVVSGEHMARMLHDYATFIIFPVALFCISGGIFIALSNYSTPKRNLILLLAGIVLTNFLGVIGASLLLIRPFLRTNKYRLAPFHIVLFIFIIGNAGGALTPIGEAPLFMGYIVGVPFFWSLQNLWAPWLAVNGILLAVFYVFDRRNFARMDEPTQTLAVEKPEKLVVSGLHNIPILAVVIAAVFIQRPLYLREGILLVMAAASYLTTNRRIHENNQFSFKPMRETAVIFFGIFITMTPALEWIEANAAALKLNSPGHYFWASSIVSPFLDNAPTYISFLAAALGTFGMHITTRTEIGAFIAQHGRFLVAISLCLGIFRRGNAHRDSQFHGTFDYRARLRTSARFWQYITHYSLPILLPVCAGVVVVRVKIVKIKPSLSNNY